MEVHLIQEKVWLDKNKYEEAERIYYENKAKVNLIIFLLYISYCSLGCMETIYR